MQIHDTERELHRFQVRVGIAAAVVLFAAAWSLTSLTVDASGDAAPTARLFAGAFPAFVFLTGPIAVGRLLALRFPALGRTTRPVAARP